MLIAEIKQSLFFILYLFDIVPKGEKMILFFVQMDLSELMIILFIILIYVSKRFFYQSYLYLFNTISLFIYEILQKKINVIDMHYLTNEITEFDKITICNI